MRIGTALAARFSELGSDADDDAAAAAVLSAQSMLKRVAHTAQGHKRPPCLPGSPGRARATTQAGEKNAGMRVRSSSTRDEVEVCLPVHPGA